MRTTLHLGLAAFAMTWIAAGVPARADHLGACQSLHDAVFLDEAREVRNLLALGVDVNCLDVLGQTPLVTAVNGASRASFNVLLAAGAKVDVRTEFGQTLLQHTKKKYASFTMPGGEAFRDLYREMAARLEQAGAAN